MSTQDFTSSETPVASEDASESDSQFNITKQQPRPMNIQCFSYSKDIELLDHMKKEAKYVLPFCIAMTLFLIGFMIIVSLI
jgi:hypothetical protein